MSTTYDLAMTRTNGQNPAIQQLAGPGDSGEVVTGGNKLAQLFTVLLMTEKGSISYAPKRGSNFINILKMNGMFSEQDVFTAFTGAQLDLRVQLTPDTTKPLDEQFNKATLNQVTITDTGLILSINILSQASVGTIVELPISFTVQ